MLVRRDTTNVNIRRILNHALLKGFCSGCTSRYVKTSFCPVENFRVSGFLVEVENASSCTSFQKREGRNFLKDLSSSVFSKGDIEMCHFSQQGKKNVFENGSTQSKKQMCGYCVLPIIRVETTHKTQHTTIQKLGSSENIVNTSTRNRLSQNLRVLVSRGWYLHVLFFFEDFRCWIFTGWNVAMVASISARVA